MKKLLSVIVPCYNEQENVPEIYNELKKLTEPLDKLECDIEIIFVDDGSTDRTVEKVQELSELDEMVRSVIFTRNFGKEAAIYAGLVEAKGDFVALIDADLQDPPSLIPEMFETVLSGEYDCAATRRVTRKGEPPIRSLFAKLFYKLINSVSDTHIVDGARDFRIMSREMVDSVIEMSERNRFSKGIFSWVGYRTKWFEYENIERVHGKTKWSFFKLMVYALDGITAFSTKPLVISALIGLLFFALSFVMIVVIIIRTLVFGDPVSGWPSMICIIFFVSGVQLFCVGILGIYLSKIYVETKNRPIYLKRKNNYKKNKE